MRRAGRFGVLAAIFAVIFLASAAFAQEKSAVAVYMAGVEPPGAMGVHKVLGGELARTISRSEKYTAVDRTDAILRQLESEASFQRSGAVSDEQIMDLGKQFGVQYLCITDISTVKGNSYYLDVRMLDVVTAQIVRTVTIGSQLRNANEMIQVAQKIAYELIETEKIKEQAQQNELKRKRTKKKAFYMALGADVVGAGLVAYGVYENRNVKKHSDDLNFSDAQKSANYRNAAFMASVPLILGGISIHIFF